MAKRKAFVKRHILTCVKFLLAAAVIQSFVLLLFTPSGLSLMYSCVSRLSSYRITVGDNSYVDYYVFRDELESADVISLSLDKDAQDSYALAADFLASIKYSARLSAVALDEPYELTSVIAECAAAGSYEELSAHLEELSAMHVGNGLLRFAEAIYQVNSALPPQSRIAVECISPDYYVDHAMSQLSIAVESEEGELPEELLGYMEARDYIAVCRLLDSYEAYRGTCGEALDRIAEAAAPLFDAELPASDASARRLADVEDYHSDAVLVIVGSDRSHNELYSECKDVELLLLDIVCAANDADGSDGSFTCRLVKLSDVDWFERYRSAVLGEDSDSDAQPAYRFYIGD